MTRRPLWTPQEAQAEVEAQGSDEEEPGEGCLLEGGCCLFEAIVSGACFVLVGLIPLLMR